MKTFKLALTAAAVAMSLGFAESAVVRNDAASLEQMQNRLIELNAEANNIKARAAAEQRDMTDDERKDLDQIFASFEELSADIERLERLDTMNASIAAPAGRRTEADGAPDTQAAANPNQTRAQIESQRQRASVPAQPRDNRETGKWGFRSQGEYFSAVVKASQRGAAPDPRLIANAPTSYGSEGVGADGGFAVPPDFRTAIVQKVMAEDSLLGRTDQMTTSSNSITVPTDETTPWQATGGIQAYWESEGGQKQQSKPQLTEKTVKANKIIALVPMTDELLQDAPSMAAYVASKAPVKIDFKVNQALISGTGVGQPLGFLNSGALVTVAAQSAQTADTVVYDNIVNMYTRMPASAKRTAVWLVNEDVEAQLMKMQFPGTGTAVPVYLPPGGLSAAPYGTLLGRPVITSEAAPALGDVGDISFVDFSQYMSVVKAGGVKQDVSIHLFFDYDITAFRFVLRVGGQPWWNTPITRANGSSRSPFVTLAAR
ncbi:HK97 family phage major capsid protein [Variovorax sp. OAS795]|uniref:phage major capsid protein n=1 Tax=Variovorax sp. OAS795 TaxID=3034231 RepID=UPI003390F4DD